MLDSRQFRDRELDILQQCSVPRSLSPIRQEEKGPTVSE